MTPAPNMTRPLLSLPSTPRQLLLLMPHFSDLAPCDLILFPNMKLNTKDNHFDNVEEIYCEFLMMPDTLKEQNFKTTWQAWQKHQKQSIAEQSDCCEDFSDKYWIGLFFLFLSTFLGTFFIKSCITTTLIFITLVNCPLLHYIQWQDVNPWDCGANTTANQSPHCSISIGVVTQLFIRLVRVGRSLTLQFEARGMSFDCQVLILIYQWPISTNWPK